MHRCHLYSQHCKKNRSMTLPARLAAAGFLLAPHEYITPTVYLGYRC
jgi:hypothetical protein